MKQSQKLIQLGLEHVFHAVTISEETGSETLTKATFANTVGKLGATAERTVSVGCDLASAARMPCRSFHETLGASPSKAESKLVRVSILNSLS
jgi:hypothetical protein